jgi:hypothetical protein
MAASMACCSRGSEAAAPREKFSILAPLATAKAVPLITSAVVPEPVLSSTLTGRIFTSPG